MTAWESFAYLQLDVLALAVLLFFSGGASNLSARDTKPLPTDEWVHMTGIFRPGEVMEVYVNSELRGTNTTGIPANQHGSNGLAALIGNRHAASNCGWTGLIDDVRVYSRAVAP